MNIYEVDFVGMWPVGNCLIIKAKNMKETNAIAENTILHEQERPIKVKKVDLSKSGVIVYLSGDY